MSSKSPGAYIKPNSAINLRRLKRVLNAPLDWTGTSGMAKDGMALAHCNPPLPAGLRTHKRYLAWVKQICQALFAA